MSDLPPSRRDEREAKLAEIERNLLSPDVGLDEWRWLIAEVRSLSQQLDAAKADYQVLLEAATRDAMQLNEAKAAQAKAMGLVVRIYLATEPVMGDALGTYRLQKPLIDAMQKFLNEESRAADAAYANRTAIPASPRA